MAARDEAGRAWTGVPQGQSADEKSADEKMGPALPASHGPRTWDGGQVPCEGRPDTRWSGQAPSREPRGRSRFRPADCVRTEEITLDTVNLIQGGHRTDPVGYDAAKKVLGRKRHILTDTLGLLLAVRVHPAS